MGTRLTLEEIYEKSCEKFGSYPVGSRHEPLFGVACRAYDCGYCDADSLEAELKRMWAQYGQGTVDDADCHNTAVHVWERASCPDLTTASGWREYVRVYNREMSIEN